MPTLTLVCLGIMAPTVISINSKLSDWLEKLVLWTLYGVAILATIARL